MDEGHGIVAPDGCVEAMKQPRVRLSVLAL